MANHSLFSLVLVVISFMCLIAYGKSYDPLPTLEVMNGLPESYVSQTLDIRIKSQHRPLDERTLRVGESFQLMVATPTTYYLYTTLGSQSASVSVFEPTRDGGHSIVYSLVKEDGFYLSYDKVTWKIIDTWQK